MFLKWGWLNSLLLGALWVVGSVGVGSAAEFACTSGDAACLITSIETANANGESNIITLEAGTYTLTTVNNDTEGPNGLPSITSTLQIIGTGVATTIVERDGPQFEAPVFRILHVGPNGDLTIENLTIQKGLLMDLEFIFPVGGAGLSNQGTVRIKNSAILENVSSWGRGGGGIYNRGSVFIVGSLIEGNIDKSGNGAAGIRNVQEGTLNIHSSVIANNNGIDAIIGGIDNQGQATVTESTIRGNMADAVAGGIFNSGTMTLSRSFLSNNFAFHAAGAVQIGNSGTLTILNSTLTNCCSPAIRAYSGSPTQPSVTRIINSTITATSYDVIQRPAVQGPDNADEGSVELENTIVANNQLECSGNVISNGFNLIGDPTRCSMVLLSSDEIGDPGLGPLSDDTTPGNGHFPLLPNSKAVDSGSNSVCPPTDQLGQTRPIDGDKNGTEDCDIGAVEFQPSNQAPMVSAGSEQTIILPSGATLNGTVTDDGLPNPPGRVTTTWSKASGPGTVTFGNAAAVDTTATFSEAGTNVLRLTATDGALTSSAEVTITVNPPWVETVPDIRGLWTEGPVGGFATACQNPADNGPFNDPGGETYRITNQTGASFSVNKLETVVDGRDTVVQATTCAGTVAANGTVTAACTYNVSLNGTFWYNGTSTLTGSLMGNALRYTLAGQDQVGDTCQWTQSGTDTRSGPVPPPVPINRWSIAGIGDLDGNSTADLLWRDTTTGAVAAWFMNGLDVTSSAVLATIPPDWVIGGVGDLDNNGTEDVVWRHPSSGTVAAWYMTPGTGAVERGEVLATGLPADWIITGMGDLDGNDTADVVWRHVPSGLVAAWYMMPGTGAIDRSDVLATIPPDWVIGGVGDLDDNETADVLWRHPSSGTVAAWYMTPGTGAVGPSKVLASGLPGDWLIGGMGDLDNNGTADVVWRHQPSGLVAAWLMTPGTGEVGTSDLISTIPPDWNIAGMGDLNLGSGPADVVWHHPSSGLAAGWLMNGLTVEDSGVIDAP